MFVTYHCCHSCFTEDGLRQMLREFRSEHLSRIARIAVNSEIESPDFIPYSMAERSRQISPDGKTHLCHWFCRILLNDCIAEDLYILPMIIEDYCGSQAQIANVIVRDELQVEVHFFINQIKSEKDFPEGSTPPIWLVKCIEALLDQDKSPRSRYYRICAAVRAYAAYTKDGSGAG